MLSQKPLTLEKKPSVAGLLASVLGIHKVQLKAYETRAFGMTVMHSLFVGATAIILDQLARSGTPISVPIIFAFVYLGICAGSRFVLLQVLNWTNVIYKQFNFSKYPDHVRQLDIYSFKPLVILVCKY